MPDPAPVDPDLNLRFVRALARELVRDPNDVDDLVQETWLAARRRGWRAPEARSSFAYLAGLVRSVAWTRRRSEGRRARRERESARPEACAPDTELVERLELRQRVVDVVLELDEPYRIVLLLRYEEELGPREIARRLGVPVETVRTRLRRALERVRARLDERCGGRGAWVVSLAALATTRTARAVAIKVALASVGVVLLVAGIRFVGVGGGESVGRTGPNVGLEPPGESENASPGPVAAGRPVTVPTPLASTPIREPLAIESEPDALRFTVLTSDDLRPVPGAIVHGPGTGDPPRSTTSEPEALETLDVERDLHERGRRYVADERGEVLVRGLSDGGWICARSGSRWGARRVSADEAGPHVLEIGEDRELRVRVLDSEGLPVGGIPIEVLSRNDGATGLRSSIWHGVSRVGDGGAIVTHVDYHVHRHQARDLSPPQAARYFVEVALPIVPHPAVEFELSSPALTPVELRLPPLGRLRVRLKDADGNLVRAGGIYHVSTAEAGTVSRSAFLGLPSDSGRFEDGSFELSRVGLGQAFEVTAHVEPGPDGSSMIGRRVVGGPTPDEPTREHVIAVEPVDELFRGRLLDADGEPLADAAGRYVVDWNPGSGIGPDIPRRLSTDAEGRFADAWKVMNLRRGAWTLYLRVDVAGGVPLVGSFEFPFARRALGDLRLEPAPLLAEGRVVDERGRPVPGAEVAVSGCRREPPEDENAAGEDEVGWLSYHWSPVEVFDGVCDESGTFRLYGRPWDPHLSLCATGDEVTPARRTRFTPGERDLEVLAVHPGTIDGMLILPDFVEPEELRVGIVEWRLVSRLSFCFSKARYCAAQPEPSGRFRLEWIPFERVGVCVTFGEQRLPLVTIEDVPVELGGASEDPRLDAIDLTRCLNRLTLLVVDEEGQPVPEAKVELRRAGATVDAPTLHRVVRDGELRCAVPWARLDVTVRAGGFRACTVALDVGANEVTLERK